jgi:hypothetical protein
MSRSLSVAAAADHEVTGMIERVIADVPPPRSHEVDDPDRAAEALARGAAQRAAVVSGSLALPPGPLGMLRQMVADIFGLYGRSADLTRTHMLYCLFRHAASQVLRDVAVRAGQRFVLQQLSSGALRTVLSSVGVAVTKRIAGAAATRWVPIAGAAAVASYAYWDTLQVAKTARKLLSPADTPAARHAGG